jgi:hypothetical protein
MTGAKGLAAYWESKGYSLRTIHDKLVTRFHEKAAASSSVTNWLGRLHFGEDIFEPGTHSEKPSNRLVDFTILMELNAFLFTTYTHLLAHSRFRCPRSGIMGKRSHLL